MPAPQQSASFRLANGTDIAHLLELMREFYQYERLDFDPTAARAALQGLIDDARKGGAWLIEVGVELAGYVVLTVGYSLEFHGPDAFVDEIFIFEQHRGTGLGKQAVAFLEEQCRQRGIRALHLEVDDKDAKAQDFYRRLKFQEHRRHLMTRWL